MPSAYTTAKLTNPSLQKSETVLDLLRFLNKQAKDNPRQTPQELYKLYKIAETSKIPLLFLEKTSQSPNMPQFFDLFSEYRLKYFKMLSLAKRTADLLEEKKVSYVFFKTLRPFPAVGSDIDILIFDKSLETVKQHLSGSYQVLDSCADNLTLYCPLFGMKLDLHSSLSVSLFPYLDANILKEEVQETSIDQTPVKVFSPEAEAVITACHSIFKEQMLTLADCYMFQHLLPLCDKPKLARLLKENNVTAAFKISTALSMLLFEVAGASKLPKVDDGFPNNVARYEFARLIRQDLFFPYKYSWQVILLCFGERALLNREGQHGASKVTKQLFNRVFLRRLTDRLPKHFKRVSY